MIADVLAAIVFPIGTAAFLAAAVLLPLTFPDRQPWRFLLVWACLGLSVFSLLLSASATPYATLEFEPTRLWLRVAYGATLCFLLPFMAIYFRRSLALRVQLWMYSVREWVRERAERVWSRQPKGNGP